MRKIVNSLAQVPPLLPLRTDLAHNKVRTAQRDALGVNAHKDFGDSFNIELIAKRNNADLGIFDPH